MFMRQRGRRVWRLLLPVCCTVLVLLGVAWAASATQAQAEQEALRLTEENIRRAAVQCYALEGSYPMNLAYLEDHYGIRPDHHRFIVHYQFIADNLMPDITVLPMGDW